MQFSFLPTVPQYWRCTLGVLVPASTKLVSSMIPMDYQLLETFSQTYGWVETRCKTVDGSSAQEDGGVGEAFCRAWRKLLLVYGDAEADCSNE